MEMAAKAREEVSIVSSEPSNLDPEAPFPSRICLLLRLGWTEFPAMDSTTDPYLAWATEYAEALWNRAVCAHMRADDRLAIASLRQLEPLPKQIAREAAKRNLPPPELEERDAREMREWAYLPWLYQSFPDLLADQERRAKQQKRPTVVSSNRDQYRDRTARIAALIDDLQEVAVGQGNQRGSLEPFIEDPTVAALVAEGKPAIEPLLQEWESNSTRLTRSVSFS